MNEKITRREMLMIGGAGALSVLAAGRAGGGAKNSKSLFYVGTYTSSGKSEGIYICRFDSAKGTLERVGVVKDVPEPSYLALDAERGFLFAVNELLEYEGEKSGAVSAFAIDRASGDLKFLNRVTSLGGAPCHLSVSSNGRFVLVANYLGGNVVVLPVAADGRLGPAVSNAKHSGSGPRTDRQEAPHAHSITLAPSGKFAFAADLGADRIMNYRFDPATGKLEPNPAQASFESRPGDGPRHFDFHPSGRFAYVINELSLSVTALGFDRGTGVLSAIQTVPVVETAQLSSTCADIHVSPDGKFLYGSVRGHNQIASFAIDQKTGRLTALGNVSCGGRKPRNFTIDPSGKFMLVANQDSDNIVVFRIDPKTGKPEANGATLQIPVPVCLRFA